MKLKGSMATQTSTVSAERGWLQVRSVGLASRGLIPYRASVVHSTEDYFSDNDHVWESFPHERTRSRAYRWGEDGLLVICDDNGFLCFSLALWNEKDPIIKERDFEPTNREGNHGEDVKEYYYYLGATPSASYKTPSLTNGWSQRTSAAAGPSPSSTCCILESLTTTVALTSLLSTPKLLHMICSSASLPTIAAQTLLSCTSCLRFGSATRCEKGIRGLGLYA
jgi:hypothetical protein